MNDQKVVISLKRFLLVEHCTADWKSLYLFRDEAVLPPNTRLRCSRSLNRLIHEAERAVKLEDNQLWVQELE